MRIKNILFFFIALSLSIIFLGCDCTTPPTITNDQTIEKNKREETVIYIEPILQKDIETRLDSFVSESVNPIKITNEIEDSNYDIAIFINNNLGNEENLETIYSIKPTLSPKELEYFNDDVSDIKIDTHIKNNTQITEAVNDYLKKSYEDNPPKENKLVFTGCILPSRWVALRAQQHNDYTYPFHHTAEITKNADLTIANLETPFTETGPYTELGMVFRGDPGLVDGLTYSGFDIVNLANNHFGDSGRDGMNYTFDLLDENNIDYFGAGKNAKASQEPLVKEINGIKYAFLGYADTSFTPASYASSENYAGLNIMDENNLIEDLKKVKDKADFIIVSMHAGTEYTYNPNSKQTSFAHTAIENGADMVYGHHPHVVQAIEYYKNKPIFYSPGNFSMDQIERNTQQGFIIEVKTMFDRINSINVIPYHIYDYSQPKLTEEDESKEILKNVINASKLLNDEK